MPWHHLVDWQVNARARCWAAGRSRLARDRDFAPPRPPMPPPVPRPALLRPPPATATGIVEAVRLIHSSPSILNSFRAFGELDPPRRVGPNLGETGFQPLPTVFCRGIANLLSGHPQKIPVARFVFAVMLAA